MALEVAEFIVADPAETWARAGFAVDPDGCCRIGGVRIRLAGGGDGIVGWSLRGLPADFDGTLDGIPTTATAREIDALPTTHANGVTAIDHVVLLTPHLTRTVSALESVGVSPRRSRDATLGGRPVRQVFFRLGEVIVEAVGSPDDAGDGPASLWGLTHVVADVDATAAYLGDRTSRVKDAVQPGRRITTLRHREFGMSVATAFLSPPYPRTP